MMLLLLLRATHTRELFKYVYVDVNEGARRNGCRKKGKKPKNLYKIRRRIEGGKKKGEK